MIELNLGDTLHSEVQYQDDGFINLYYKNINLANFYIHEAHFVIFFYHHDSTIYIHFEEGTFTLVDIIDQQYNSTLDNFLQVLELYQIETTKLC